MKLYKSKIMRVINFIRNERKFESGDMVRIVSAESDPKYDHLYKKYIGQLGIVTGIDYTKKDYIFGVKFENGKSIDFRDFELEKILPENPIRYKKLNIEC